MKATTDETNDASNADTELAVLLSAQLRRLLEEPLTPKLCNKIVRTANAAKMTLYAISDAPPLRRRHGLGLQLGGNMDYIDEEPIEAAASINPGYYNAETMGTSAIKELVDGLKSMTKKSVPIDNLIGAYQKAKDAGLDDVAAKLRKKIETEVDVFVSDSADPAATTALVAGVTLGLESSLPTSVSAQEAP